MHRASGERDTFLGGFTRLGGATKQLLAIGFLWSFTALAESELSVPHTIGRLATFLTFPCVVYLLLAFPHGRIENGFDRAVLAAIVGVMLVLCALPVAVAFASIPALVQTAAL